ncbi:MAG TPA: AraC family transcriptional regulator [Acidimicrobiia bacterium]
MAGPSKELYRDGTTVIGTWFCRPSDAEFPGGWMDNPTLVFPRSSVVITQEGEEPLVTDPSMTVMYRGSQEYSRRLVDPVGDRCDWFEVDTQLIRDVAQEIEPAAVHRDESPIKHTHAPASSETYILQRMLIRHVASEPNPDHFLIQETVTRIVDAVVRAAYGRTNDEPQAPRHDHRELVEDTKAYIALHFADRLTLADVGRAVGASSFHLARLFRGLTGRTVHRHLTDIRLRAALDRLENDSSDIADIALSVGFASHSHLTKVFHERFGMTPSAFRAQSSAHLREIVIA